MGRNGGCIYLECNTFDCHNGKIVACDKSKTGNIGIGGSIRIVINERVIRFDGWSHIGAYGVNDDVGGRSYGPYRTPNDRSAGKIYIKYTNRYIVDSFAENKMTQIQEDPGSADPYYWKGFASNRQKLMIRPPAIIDSTITGSTEEESLEIFYGDIPLPQYVIDERMARE